MEHMRLERKVNRSGRELLICMMFIVSVSENSSVNQNNAKISFWSFSYKNNNLYCRILYIETQKYQREQS